MTCSECGGEIPDVVAINGSCPCGYTYWFWDGWGYLTCERRFRWWFRRMVKRLKP